MNKVIMKGVLDGIVIERIVRDKDFTMPSVHIHPEFEFYYLLDGARYFFIEDKTYPMKKGSLALVNSEQIHKTSTLGRAPHDRFLIELTAEPFASFFRDVSGLSFSELFDGYMGVWNTDEREQQTIEGIIAAIAEEFREQKAHYQTYVMMKIAELMLFVTRLKADERVGTSLAQTWKYTQINNIAEYITQNYRKEITLDKLCGTFYISKSYLCGSFREVTGSTVQEYIHLCRVKKAREMLENSTESIADISHFLGYGTVTHFERMFRRYMETSPLKYRKKMSLIQKKVRERKDEDAGAT